MGGKTSKGKVDLITCGLDNSGKSTIVNFLKPDKQKADDLAPTVGYQVERFMNGKVEFKVYDMGGAKKFRDLWGHHLQEIQAVIFVIDSVDKVRNVLVKDELNILLEALGPGVPILFFANKMDLPNSMPPQDMAQSLGLAELCSSRPWNIVASNALTGQGVDPGIQWITETLAKQPAKK